MFLPYSALREFFNRLSMHIHDPAHHVTMSVIFNNGHRAHHWFLGRITLWGHFGGLFGGLIGDRRCFLSKPTPIVQYVRNVSLYIRQAQVHTCWIM